MAKEPDQTKWVGIRPTDPSEDIPTTTRKILPAISDLQAIKIPFDKQVIGANKNCTVVGTLNMPLVSAGELCIITNVSLVNQDSMCDIRIRASVTGASVVVKCFYSVPAGNYVSAKVFIVLPEDGAIRSAFRLGGASDDIEMNCIGYIVGVY